MPGYKIGCLRLFLIIMTMHAPECRDILQKRFILTQSIFARFMIIVTNKKKLRLQTHRFYFKSGVNS